MKFIIRTKSGSKDTLYFRDVGMGTTSLREEAHVYDSVDEDLAPFIKHANNCEFVVVPVAETDKLYRSVLGELYKVISGVVHFKDEDGWVVSQYGSDLTFFQDGISRGYLVEVK